MAKAIKNLTSEEFKSLSGLWRIDRLILDTLDYSKVVNRTVNAILTELDYLKLGYEIIVLTLVDKTAQIIRRVSISKTKTANKALINTPIPFAKIEIPLSAKDNLLVKAVHNKKIYLTHDLSDVLYPAATRDVWRNIQDLCNIKTSIVYPVIARDKVNGAMIFSLSKEEKAISKQEWEILAGFTNAVGIALDNATLYSRLEQANAKLQELDKRKDEFLNVAAHELRAPMTAIKGYLSMILEGDAGEIPEQMKDFLSEASQGNERLIRLVNNMLNVARIEEGRLVFQMGAVSLIKVVQTVFNEFKIQAKQKNLQYALEIANDIKDSVYVDQDRIHEVVANFISNAIKYTDQGSVTVRLFQSGEQKIRFEVKDTGEGMTPAEQEKLFQKFYRAGSSAGKQIGTGLGLYISKLLVEKFSGQVGFESAKGKGSTFWFQLPVTQEQT